jgi:hypothetical protein
MGYPSTTRTPAKTADSTRIRRFQIADDRMIYTHVLNRGGRGVASPADVL